VLTMMHPVMASREVIHFLSDVFMIAKYSLVLN